MPPSGNGALEVLDKAPVVGIAEGDGLPRSDGFDRDHKLRLAEGSGKGPEVCVLFVKVP